MILYTKPNCPQCDATKKYIDAKGLSYNVIDLTTSEDAMAFVVGLGYRQAPVVYVNENTHWSGFRPDLICNT